MDQAERTALGDVFDRTIHSMNGLRDTIFIVYVGVKLVALRGIKLRQSLSDAHGHYRSHNRCLHRSSLSAM